MKKNYLLFCLFLISLLHVEAQTGTEFWFAAPEVTSGHGDNPIFIRVSTGANPATVTIEMPADGSFTPITVILAANTSFSQNMTAFKDQIETKPENTILTTGILVTATADISAYYEVNRTNNPDIFALKGESALGTEFYTPFQTIFANHNTYSPIPYASFDIVATEDNTLVRIYPRKDLVGRPAFAQFTVTLQRGETFSNRSASLIGSEKPAGSVIVADKPIAVTIKDDSNKKNTSGEGCKDLLGDQIVPVDIIGREYIVTQGGLTTEESFFVLATENNTDISIDGVYSTTLFAGETAVFPVTQAHTFVQATGPVYLTHVSGFGCEMGMAILPPLNCAGSEQVFFTRSTTEYFGLNLLIRAGAEDGFSLNGNTTLIQASDFVDVPGTGGGWKAAQLSFNTATIPVDVSNLITNSKTVFGMGIIHGGASTGCRFGYFSEFKAPIEVDAGIDQLVCDGNAIQLAGDISGGVNTGTWTTNGSGGFASDVDFGTVYTPSASDYAIGNLEFRLKSTGICPPSFDTMAMNFTAAPTVDVGVDQKICDNNTDVTLAGSVLVAPGAYWHGGNGTFIPDTTTLTATYQPTDLEVSSGSIYLSLTNLDYKDCVPQKDSFLIDFTAKPIIDAGTGLTSCGNNADATLSGNVTSSTGFGSGTWLNGGGFVTPSNNALTGVYTPTASEISNGSAKLVLASDNGDNCDFEYDTVQLAINPTPIVDAGVDQAICINNTTVQLSGSITNATAAKWIGGLGAFSPDRNTLNATYLPDPTELASGTLSLTLETTTMAANCLPENDAMTITFTAAPTIDAGTNQSVCENNPSTVLGGTFTLTAGAKWSNYGGTFTTGDNQTMNATYLPSSTEVTNGKAVLYLTSFPYSNCLEVIDSIVITMTPSPVVNAGTDLTSCANNADAALNGSVITSSGFGGGTWVNITGFVTPSSTSLTGVYSPTGIEIATGNVDLVLSSDEGDNCDFVYDTVKLNIVPSPIVSAGADQSICNNNTTIQLNGSLTNASAAQWVGGAGVFAPNRTTLNATYEPTITEIALGIVTLTLESTMADPTCLSESDDVTFTFTASPVLDAGANQSVCENNPSTVLDGSFTLTVGATWSNYGGIFTSGNNQATNATYLPSSTEITNGEAVLYLTSLPYSNCSDVIDSVVITMTPSPVVNAGTDLTSCANNSDAALSGSVIIESGFGGGSWINGAGFVTPSSTSLTGVYSPTALEIAIGNVDLVLSSNEGNNCNFVYDTVQLDIVASPIVNAGADESVCDNKTTIQLNGSLTNATAAQWIGGAGVFTPNRTTLHATYEPTITEVALGTITLTLESTMADPTCLSESDDVIFTFTGSPVLDAGANQSVCENNPTVILDGSFTLTTGATWSNYSGTFTSGNDQTMNATYLPSSTEITNGEAVLYLTNLPYSNCSDILDSVVITMTPSPIVSAGTDITTCANNADAALNGSVIIESAFGGGTWSNGNGFVSPTANALTGVYTPTATEISNGFVKLVLGSNEGNNCVFEYDTVRINIESAPITNAGTDQIICANNSTIQLNASVTNATGGTWIGGLGTFTPNRTTLNATYEPTASETALGTLTLSLESTGGLASCLPETDDLLITFSAAPTVDAGPAQFVCGNNSNVSLTGVVTFAAGATWSNYDGTFVSGDNLTLNAVYKPSASEVTNGKAVLYLTTLPYLNCSDEQDSIVISISPAPTVSAGSNVVSCANNASAVLNGSFTNASGIAWSGGTGSFVPSLNAANTTYIPSPTEITAGGLKLYISTFDAVNNCLSEKDSMTLTINSAPIISAGIDQMACANNANSQLAASISLAAGGVWSGGLGTYSPSTTSLNAIYTPTTTEISGGNVTLTFTSTGNGWCNAVNDEVLLTYTPSPTVTAGLDQQVCENNTDTDLDGGFTISTASVWLGGNGTFTPNASDPKAVYSPTNTELLAGSVTLKLQTTGNGICNAVFDEMEIDFTPKPSVNAGIDLFVCADNLTAALSGLISGGTTTGSWSTTGTGVFFPNQNSLTATYLITAQDSLNGNVQLTLESSNNGNCLPAQDDVLVTITTPGAVGADIDQVVCANNPIVTLNGSTSGGATTGTWTSDGTGVFSPNGSALNATYKPSNLDIINGSITLTLTGNSCDLAQDEMVISVSSGPVVNAGTDQRKCISSPDVQLKGTVSGASTTGQWISTGTGSFAPSNADLNAVYSPSASDLTSGNFILFLSPTNIGNCVNTRDTMQVVVSDLGTVDVGADRTQCANSGNISLNAVLTGGATNGYWTSTGTGSFSPIPNVTDPDYVPSVTDIGLGNVTLTYISNSCDTAKGSLSVNFTPAPSVNAGLDEISCANDANIALAGSFSLALGSQWTTNGSGTFNPNNVNINATYIPSQADIDNGNTMIYLTTTGNGNCFSAVDSLSFIITPSPLVDAGKDQSICFNSLETQLAGIVSQGSATGEWMSTGTGTFNPGNTTLNTKYTLSSSDSLLGSVALILKSTNNGNCLIESDTMIIKVGSISFVDAGTDQLVCSEAQSALLIGTVAGGASKGKWHSLGDGSFTPNDSSLTVSYSFGLEDEQNTSARVVLTSVSENGCASNSDTVLIKTAPVTTISAGIDQVICENLDSVLVKGELINGSVGKWQSLGDGVFLPNDSTLSPTYHFGTADKTFKVITLVFSSKGDNNCEVKFDTSKVTLTNPVTVGFTVSGNCTEENILFTDTSNTTSGTITSWTWDLGNEEVSNAQNPKTIYATAKNYDVQLTVESSTGCSRTTTETITISDPPVADFLLLTKTPKTFEVVEFEDQSTDAVFWRWTMGNEDTLYSQNPTYTYYTGGDYNVRLYIENNVGCTDSTNQVITVLEDLILPPKLPTAFTPNGDGENDIYYVRGGPFSVIDFRIYNQWGELIFETNDPDEGWDGTYKDKEQPLGVYLFTVTATTVDGEDHKKTGEVNLIR